MKHFLASLEGHLIPQPLKICIQDIQIYLYIKQLRSQKKVTGKS